MPLLVEVQRSPEWFDAHLFRITGSSAAGALALDPWNGPLATFNKITGRTTTPDNPHMKWGREKEQVALAAYEVQTGALVQPTGFWVHPRFDWLGASPDGFIGKAGMVEIKCPSTDMPRELPPHYEVQVRVQLAVTERAWCDFYAWTPTGTLLLRVQRDLRRERELLGKLEQFYKRYIVPDSPPPRRRDKLCLVGTN
jgi:putative phage-type endonuclease